MAVKKVSELPENDNPLDGTELVVCDKDGETVTVPSQSITNIPPSLAAAGAIDGTETVFIRKDGIYLETTAQAIADLASAGSGPKIARGTIAANGVLTLAQNLSIGAYTPGSGSYALDYTAAGFAATPQFFVGIYDTSGRTSWFALGGNSTGVTIQTFLNEVSSQRTFNFLAIGA